MKDVDLIKLLFEAHRDANEELFMQTAQSIIGRELSSNHHDLAQQLITALGLNQNKTIERRRLARLPSKATAEPSILQLQYPDDAQAPVLAPETSSKINRLLAEQNNRERLLAHGLRPVSRILLWGPPGNGKTITARFIAQQLRLPIGAISLSGIISSLLGATAMQLEQVFKAASSPMVLFLDEFDALGKERDDELEIGEPKRIVNSLLQNMDAFEAPRSVLIAATNHQYLLDSAVWRRFEMIVHFPLPAAKERQAHIRRLLSGIKYTGSLSSLTSSSDKMSYADLTIAVGECLKTMILENRRSLPEEALIKAITDRKRTVASARKAQQLTE